VPDGGAFGGYKESEFGRETRKMFLDHYRQTRNLLVSHRPKALGLFQGALQKGLFDD